MTRNEKLIIEKFKNDIYDFKKFFEIEYKNTKPGNYPSCLFLDAMSLFFNISNKNGSEDFIKEIVRIQVEFEKYLLLYGIDPSKWEDPDPQSLYDFHRKQLKS